MKKTARSICLLLLVTCLFIGPAFASSASEIETRLDKISQLEKYKPGASTFGQNGCWVFVNSVSNLLYGINIPNRPEGYVLKGTKGYWSQIGSAYDSAATNAAVSQVLRKAQAGDIIQYCNSWATWQHTAMIYSNRGDRVILYDFAGYKVLKRDVLFDNLPGTIGNFGGISGYGITLYRCGHDISTAPLPPSGINISVSAATKEADTITETSAVLRGEVSASGGRITECGMYIGTSSEEMTLLGSDKGLSTYGTPCYYSTSKYGYPLKPGTTYYYQVYAVAGNTTEKGETKSFTTPGGGTLLLTNAEVSGITETSAHVEATCSYTGTPPSHVGIYFGATPEELSVHDWDAIKHDRTAFSVQFDLRDLDRGTTYYYQFFAMTDRGVQKGEVGSFQTEGTEELVPTPTPAPDSDPTPPPTPTVGPDIKVYTKGADTITETSAIVRGDFSVVDGRASECGMYLGTSKDNLTKLGSDAINSAGVAFYYSTAKFGRTLTPGTTYYYRAYVVVNGETYWGETASFTTASSVTVTTKGADSITATAATVRGQVVSPKQKASECGMYLGTSPGNMTKLGSDAINANNMPFYYGTAKYGRPLTAGTTYYYQAYAIVNGVTYWGEVKSFTTATR